MAPYLVVVCVAFALQLVTGLLYMARLMHARDFYQLAAMLMLTATTTWAVNGSWYALLPGFMAVLWLSLATSEKRNPRPAKGLRT